MADNLHPLTFMTAIGHRRANQLHRPTTPPPPRKLTTMLT